MEVTIRKKPKNTTDGTIKFGNTIVVHYSKINLKLSKSLKFSYVIMRYSSDE